MCILFHCEHPAADPSPAALRLCLLAGGSGTEAPRQLRRCVTDSARVPQQRTSECGVCVAKRMTKLLTLMRFVVIQMMISS